jgi:hypothetical protein
LNPSLGKGFMRQENPKKMLINTGILVPVRRRRSRERKQIK